MSDVPSLNAGKTSIRVVAICGSLRRDSHTRKALRLALAGAAELGAETKLLDLRDYELVFCDGDTEDEDLPEGVQRLKQEVQAAHGIILGTPEYHGGYSGVLKNALDLMGFAEFEGKMIGLLGVSGGSMGAVNSLTSLRAVGRALHAWVLPEEVSIPRAGQQFDAEGNLTDPRLAERVRELGRQVARFAFLHTSEQALEFLRAWENAPYNPGGG
ncbi:MAG: NAD(P)H-dependent oxidoreductase [Caldilineales bacterium]|nr:NAD(P)H-dependent oxidoreductase [Caldilineales bacterium]MDW8319232.1 NADPH-dependent FMN reductase [Anaerolineae bacterium]